MIYAAEPRLDFVAGASADTRLDAACGHGSPWIQVSLHACNHCMHIVIACMHQPRLHNLVTELNSSLRAVLKHIMFAQ